MSAHVDDLFNYVQERCLWQFASRTWDREANIAGVLGKVKDLLTGASPKLDTPDDRLFLADAKVMVEDCRNRFAWLGQVSAAEIPALLDGLKDRLVEIVITKSKNRELNHSLY